MFYFSCYDYCRLERKPEKMIPALAGRKLFGAKVGELFPVGLRFSYPLQREKIIV
jgi:hypothetical protein